MCSLEKNPSQPFLLVVGHPRPQGGRAKYYLHTHERNKYDCLVSNSFVLHQTIKVVTSMSVVLFLHQQTKAALCKRFVATFLISLIIKFKYHY